MRHPFKVKATPNIKIKSQGYSEFTGPGLEAIRKRIDNMNPEGANSGYYFTNDVLRQLVRNDGTMNLNLSVSDVKFLKENGFKVLGISYLNKNLFRL